MATSSSASTATNSSRASGPNGTAPALKQKGVRPFDLTGRPMAGWVLVSQEAVAEEPELRDWVERCRAFALTLPAK